MAGHAYTLPAQDCSRRRAEISRTSTLQCVTPRRALRRRRPRTSESLPESLSQSYGLTGRALRHRLDALRWRPVVFQSSTAASFHRMDDSFANLYGAIVDPNSRTMTLTQAGDKDEAARFALDRPADGRADPRRHPGRTQTPYAASTVRSQQLPARHPRVSLDPGISVQPVK